MLILGPLQQPHPNYATRHLSNLEPGCQHVCVNCGQIRFRLRHEFEYQEHQHQIRKRTTIHFAPSQVHPEVRRQSGAHASKIQYNQGLLVLARALTMHLALPSRKSSNPPPYATRYPRIPMFRRSRAKTILIGVCALSAVLFLLSRISGRSESIPYGTPPVVIVTVLDSKSYSKEYISNIKENRNEYAKRHGEWKLFPLKSNLLTFTRLCYLFP